MARRAAITTRKRTIKIKTCSHARALFAFSPRPRFVLCLSTTFDMSRTETSVNIATSHIFKPSRFNNLIWSFRESEKGLIALESVASGLATDNPNFVDLITPPELIVF